MGAGGKGPGPKTWVVTAILAAGAVACLLTDRFEAGIILLAAAGLTPAGVKKLSRRQE